MLHCLSKLQHSSGWEEAGVRGAAQPCHGFAGLPAWADGGLVQTDLGSRCGPFVPRASRRTVCSSGVAAGVEGERQAPSQPWSLLQLLPVVRGLLHGGAELPDTPLPPPSFPRGHLHQQASDFPWTQRNTRFRSESRGRLGALPASLLCKQGPVP